jgi:hypothetical protein
MSRQRYKPTFLLRCVVFIFVIGVGFGVFALAKAAGCGILQLIVLGASPIFILLSDLISWWIVALMTRNAERNDEQSSPFWFVDSKQTKQRDAERFHEDTKDNPTLR